MLRLAQKAFFPGPIPFPLLHIDTGFKFAEMLTFRDAMARSVGAELLVWRNEPAIAAGTNPIALDTKRCCGLLKTQALLDALKHYNFDAAFGGARRDEEKSRAKERIYSFRDSAGQWDPKNQRPELWNLFNARIHPGESIRVFPLSNWTEMDVWQYIHQENIPVVDLYFAKERPMYVRPTASGQDALLPIEQDFVARIGERPQMVKSRLRSLGCSPCTGAIRSDATTIPDIIAELISFQSSERANRVIDHDQEGSMELKKREGYF
jgi:sulfate adenylyltransferase subunit 2